MHCVIKYKNTFYDAQVDNYGELTYKSPEKYRQANDSDVAYMEEHFGLDYKYLHGQRLSQYFINEIEQCNITQYLVDDIIADSHNSSKEIDDGR